MLCPKCQQPIQPNSQFCGACGQRIEAATVAGSLGASPGVAHAAGAASPGIATSPVQWASIVQRAKNIVLTPRSEWPVIAGETEPLAQVFLQYVLPMAGFAALMSLIHLSVIGISIPFGGVIRMPLVSGLLAAVTTLVFGCLGVFILGLIINGLAPTFAGFRDQRRAVRTAAYALTPAWLSSLLALSPVLPTLLQFLAGCYGIYVLYLGLPVMMKSARDKATGYTATVVICTILLGIVFGALSATFGHFGRGFGMANVDTSSRVVDQERSAQQVGNVIGGMLGTDEKGKAGLGAAISNLVKAGDDADKNAAVTPASPAADRTAAASDSAQNALGATGGLLTALGGALGGSHRATPVDFKTLKSLLPDSLPGMDRTNASGESKEALGVKSSTATGDFQGADGKVVHVTIADLTGVAGLLDMANGLVQNDSSESDSGYEKNVIVGGRSVHETYQTKARHGEASVILAKRFQVEVTGDGVTMDTLEETLGHVDLARLESMKDVGVQAQ